MTLLPEKAVHVDQFRVKHHSTVDLSDFPTFIETAMKKKEAEEALRKRVNILKDLQHQLHAEKLQSMLIVLQGMDASGKDSAIRQIFSGLNPAGIRVHSYDAPSRDEWQESYLKRHWRDVPSRGFISVFNRSHYEEVVTPRVFKHLLQMRHPNLEGVASGFWQQRFRDIAAFEEHLSIQNQTKIVKFFLHISRERQLERIKERLSKPHKHWKFDDRDLEVRKSWDNFQNAYAEAISATSTEKAPWYVIPADIKSIARLLMAETLVQTLSDMNPQFPEPSVNVKEFQSKYF